MTEKITIIDFGSQYTQLIARRVRELNVYSEIVPHFRFEGIDKQTKGLILSGSPCSVRQDNAPQVCLEGIRGSIPVLGICYGAQLLASISGGNVENSPSREYGRASVTIKDASDPLLRGLPETSQVWMSHGDTITSLPKGLKIICIHRGCARGGLPLFRRADLGIAIPSGGGPQH